MRYLLFIAPFLLLTLACNRTANKAVTQKTPQVRTKYEPTPEQIEQKDRVAAPKQATSEGYSGERSRTSTAPASKAVEGGQKLAPTVIAELTRTPCYGECAVYTIQILSDNTLRYFGRQNVDLLGEFTGQLTFDPMIRLGPLANLNRFFRLEAHYPVNKEEVPTDLPATVTMINYRGRAHTITHYFDGPEGLQEVENFFVELVEQAIWTPVEE